MAALGQNEGKAPVTTAKALEKEFLPRHVAIIMDGNGRWAQKRGMPRTFGHKAGVEALRALEMEDLDRALCEALKQSIDFVEEKGGALDPESVAAYEYAKAHLK